MACSQKRQEDEVVMRVQGGVCGNAAPRGRGHKLHPVDPIYPSA